MLAWILTVGVGVLLVVALPAGMLWMLRHPPRIEAGLTPSQLGLTYDALALETGDGVELDAWHVHARESSSTALVVGHGYPADKADVLPATAFLAAEHHLVYLDHRGLGQSGARTTLGVLEPLDVRAGIEYAAAIDGVEAVGLVGFSMGAAAAIQAADDERVRAVVAEAGYADLASLAPSLFRGLGPLARPAGWLLLSLARLIGIDARKARPAEALASHGTPTLVIHGTEDPTVPVDHGRRLAEASEHVEAWIVEGAGHGEPALEPDYEDRVGSFLAEHLDPGG